MRDIQRWPPQAEILSPVSQPISSLARNTATLAMSFGWPMRRLGRRTGSLAKLTRRIGLAKNFQQELLCQYCGVGLCQLRGLAPQQADDMHHAARGCERPLELAALEAGLNRLSGFWSGH